MLLNFEDDVTLPMVGAFGNVGNMYVPQSPMFLSSGAKHMTSSARGYSVMEQVDTPEGTGGVQHLDEAAHLGDENGGSALRPRLRRIILMTIGLI